MMTHRTARSGMDHSAVCIPCGTATLEGDLALPAGASGIVLFAHGSGSSRHSPRNQYVAEVIRGAGNGTLLFDLLTREEEREDMLTAGLRFDIELLAQRLLSATAWLGSQPATMDREIGYFGSSTGGAAALVAAANLGDRVAAVVSRGGRPDLANSALPRVTAPTLFLVGGLDDAVLQWNQDALAKLKCEKRLQVIPGATHLFEEPGKLDEVAVAAAEWFREHLRLHPAASASR